MKRLLILAEGQTEETFVKGILAPHLVSFGITAAVTCICTRVTSGRREQRGGISNYEKVRNDLRRLLSSNPTAVTTMFDYYGLPKDFPGRNTASKIIGHIERATHVERELAKDVNDHRFIPNILIHEFEALLFSSPGTIANVLLDETIRESLENQAAAFGSPEEINDSPSTAPSKRILALCSVYRKALHGPSIAAKIGLANIRARCPHFDAWVDRLEKI